MRLLVLDAYAELIQRATIRRAHLYWRGGAMSEKDFELTVERIEAAEARASRMKRYLAKKLEGA